MGNFGEIVKTYMHIGQGELVISVIEFFLLWNIKGSKYGNFCFDFSQKIFLKIYWQTCSMI